jgi:2,3-bisphosphoglycerate-independent phosphoglycerate mutase
LNNQTHKSEFNVVLLFLDGVGIGKKDARINPFFQAHLPTLTALCGGTLPHTPFRHISTDQSDVIAVNATLGVPGLPQSGTGQTAIFTGVNGARKFGRHFGPYPPSVLRTDIAQNNIFIQLKAIGKSAAFSNAFPKKYFEYIDTGSKRLTVTTLACQEAGIPLLTEKDLERAEAISADFIRGYWPEAGHPEIKPISAGDAGRHLAHIVKKNDFTLFEYWLTDHAGHSQKMSTAIEVLERFDDFLHGFMELFEPDRTLLMVVSDHGNIEDLSTKSHTRNQVPCILAGKYRHKLVRRIKNLTHITPAIIRLFLDS